MSREFTPHDIHVLAGYRARVFAYRWRLDACEREQSERRRLYGHQGAADEAAQAVIARLRKG